MSAMRWIEKALVFLSALAMGVGLAALPAFSAEVTVRISDHFPVGHPTVKYLTQPWMKRVEELSGGRIAFKHFTAGQLVGQRDAMPGLQKGIVDIALVNPGLFVSELPLSGVIFLPNGYDSFVDGGKAVTRLLADSPEIQAEYRKAGIMPLLYYALDPYEALTTRTKVIKPEDAKGLKLRAVGEAQISAARAVGMTPVNVSAPEIYTAMQRNTLDGALFAYSVSHTYRLFEVAKYGTRKARIGYATVIYSVSLRFWNRLEPSLQKVLRQTADEMMPQAWQTFEEERARAIKQGESMGFTFVEVDQKAWNDVLHPVRQEWADKLEGKGLPGNKILKAWDKALAETR